MTVLLNIIKEAKAEFIARQDEERRANLARKRDIIRELDEMAADTDNVNRHFPVSVSSPRHSRMPVRCLLPTLPISGATIRPL